MFGRTIVWVVLAWIAAAATLTADEVFLKSGGIVVGKVVEATAIQVRVKTKLGIQTFPRRDVLRIEYKKTPSEIFAERLKAIDRKDVAALLKLADWAKENQLRKESLEAYRLVTLADPNNKKAHEALGHVCFEGMWMSKKDAEAARKARNEADKLAKGLVKYQGKWVTREEKEAREKGYIKVGDRWLPPDEANRARGLVQVGGKWVTRDEAETLVRAKELEENIQVKFEIAVTKHFRVFSEFGADHAKSVGEACEKALVVVRDKVGYPAPVWKEGLRAEVILLRRAEPYMKVVDLVDKATHQAKGWADFTKTNDSFYSFIPPKSVQHLGGRRQPDMVFTTVNHVGHIALNGMFSNYTYLPIWLDEGFGVWLENATLKQSLTRTYTIGYGMVAPRKDKWSASANWKGNLKDAVADASILSLDRLVVMKLNAMGWMEIAKAWSIIDWWITTDREKFLRFIKEVRRRYPQANKHQECSPSDFKRFQNEAMKAVYGKDVVKIEKDWRNYVSTSY